MTTMIEKVARAVSLSQTQSENMWQAFLPEAHAAIEAMREPTEEMTAEGANVDSECGWCENPERIWQAMIDAALKEQP